jgi:hypothetical protein
MFSSCRHAPNDVDCPVIWKFRGENTISRSRNPRASLIEAKTEMAKLLHFHVNQPGANVGTTTKLGRN